MRGLEQLADRLVELRRRDDQDQLRQLQQKQRLSPFSLADYCGGHVEQLAYTQDRSQWIHCMGARQSGKSWGDDGMLLDNALTYGGSLNVLLGLTGTAVRQNNWIPIWQAACARHHVEHTPNQSTMMSTFPNGSRVLFGGTNDMANIRKALGNNLGNGVFIVDESQDQPRALLDDLLDNVLPPMMGRNSRVVLSGVFPDVPVGRFWDESKYSGKPGRFKSHHGWGRFANIHTPEAREILDKYLEATGLQETDPKIQRDWFGIPVFEEGATAYQYNAERNSYKPELAAWVDEVFEQAFWDKLGIKKPNRDHIMAALPLPGIDRFSFAVDPAVERDRLSIVGLGWGETTPVVQHVFEWVTAHGAGTTQGQWAGVASHAAKHYGQAQWRYDHGSSPTELDNLRRDYGLPVVSAAKKGDKLGQVRRVNDRLTRGLIKVMQGSKVEEDFRRTTWDKEAIAAGRAEWARQWHPDPAEAFRYALQGYFEAYVPPPPPKEQLTPYQEWERAERAKQQQGSHRRGWAANTRRMQ